MSAHILFYGTYSLLLDTHKLILERSGFRVTRADSFDSFRRLLDRESIDLCILCSSLTPECCDEAVSTLNILAPDLPYMVLTPGVSSTARNAGKPLVNCLAGPEFLLGRVRESLPAGAHA